MLKMWIRKNSCSVLTDKEEQLESLKAKYEKAKAVMLGMHSLLSLESLGDKQIVELYSNSLMRAESLEILEGK